ncbi:exonuclease [Sphingobacterium sp. UT-1RO-CII-1]|uniref:MBL fold metallo-hydrolase RNA specificity domain-containing protein n=1 Tax=Sphingobacterium sp. UT-1RO-CII-1 TaxID=2995225 RepID=UPI00227B1D34|nr:MBL fold metallo-hydrolase RNA specificity domain-containing protein [Sphingobacterium sp. UT-1RO-CII-1]MCY4780188.1 exonuclease [Sphingobacterium sp. UT-1RO-CII-1]
MGLILEDFLVKKEEGYFCRYGNFYIDAMQPVYVNVISHAHGDHATPGHRQMFATLATFAFMKNRFSKMLSNSLTIVGFEEEFRIGDIELKLFPAGHILGSAQILMKYKGVRYLYTGDYKLQDDPTCEPFTFVETDVLITESTFADPMVVHPNAETEILKMKDRASNIMLGCYTLGKAQRLTALINDLLPERQVLVHHRMYPVHKVYDDLGPRRLKYELYNRKAMKDGRVDKIYLVPPLTFNSYFKAKNVLRAFASGWARLQQQNDIELYISDHVDWNDLLFFINEIRPKEIWTIHGDGSKLKQHFKGVLPVRDILKI